MRHPILTLVTLILIIYGCDSGGGGSVGGDGCSGSGGAGGGGGSSGGCNDPPGYGNMRLNINRESVSRIFNGIDFRIAEVVVYYNNIPNEPQPGYQICDYSDSTLLSTLGVPVHLDTTRIGRTPIGGFSAPAGRLSEIRLFIQEASASREKVTTKATTDKKCRGAIDMSSTGHQSTKVMQSGDQAKYGILRLIPRSDQIIEIKENGYIEADALFDPNRDIGMEHNNEDSADHKLASRYDLVLAPKAVTGIVVDDRIVVAFKDNVKRTDVEQRITGRSSSIISLWAPTNYYIVRIPPGSDVKTELEYYAKMPDVLYVLPDTYISFDRVPDQMKVSKFPDIETQFVQQSRAGEAWDMTIGSYRQIVAVIDNNFNVSHPNLYRNIYINRAEIPEFAWKPVNNLLDNNRNGRRDVDDLDVDQDGFITFDDLNRVEAGDACPRGNHPPANLCDPLDLVTGKTTAAGDTTGGCVQKSSDPQDPKNQPYVGWQDWDDADQNSLCDDLIGWNFGNNSNLPYDDDLPVDAVDHGTNVAGVLGADGLNGPNLAGVAWKVRILPLVVRTGFSSDGRLEKYDTFRSDVVKALNYASHIRTDSSGNVTEAADVVNLSGGFTATRDGFPVFCPGRAVESAVANDIFDRLAAKASKELDSFNNGRSLLINSAGNCSLDLDKMVDGKRAAFRWPGSAATNVLVVASVDTEFNPNTGALSTFSAYGKESVHIAAPGEDFTVLSRSGVKTCPANDDPVFSLCAKGTSLAAPMVAGTAALILSVSPGLSPCRLAERILLGASVRSNGIGVSGSSDVGQDGTLLNINNAVRGITSNLRGQRMCP